jgi:hypothetical protein
MSDAIDVTTEDPMTPQSTPAPVAISATALRTLEKAYLEEIRSAQPDNAGFARRHHRRAPAA